ncbi:lipoyl(octanoyl) transferase LipB [Fontivita pretiosa]|uniref:lipoyl(octanoyl) transferase LipB n=1 Tax=Fontivita pretiosa TaxID=2989684 RepID=UPI003D1818BB
MHVQDLGTMPYRQAWALQQQIHAEVVAGDQERLLLVEHPPVITFGRRAETCGQKNLLASEQHLQQLGVELVQSDRGGDVTFHGPGQIVAYPIVRLNDHGLSVGGYVRRLEQVVIATLAELAIPAITDPSAVGVWVREPDGQLAKICAIGVRIRRGVSMHGIALNVETDLRYFDLIIPCGLTGRRATSLRRLLGDATPDIRLVKQSLVGQFHKAFGSASDRRAV